MFWKKSKFFNIATTPEHAPEQRTMEGGRRLPFHTTERPSKWTHVIKSCVPRVSAPIPSFDAGHHSPSVVEDAVRGIVLGLLLLFLAFSPVATSERCANAGATFPTTFACSSVRPGSPPLLHQLTFVTAGTTSPFFWDCIVYAFCFRVLLSGFPLFFFSAVRYLEVSLVIAQSRSASPWSPRSIASTLINGDSQRELTPLDP